MAKIVFASFLLASFLAAARCGVIGEPETVPYSIIDPIIKAILESLKPKLANLTIPDVNQTVRSPSLNATVLIKDIGVKNADKFKTCVLKTNMVPLKLNNLTLTWDQIVAGADYDVSANLSIPQANGPINIFGKGEARATLSKLFVTIGANMELKNNAIQVKPKGLFGFDLRIGQADVTVGSLMGSTDLGKAVGVFLSKMIPELVDTFKKPVFDAFQDEIIKVINGVLKKNGTTFADEIPMEMTGAGEFSFQTLDLGDELGFFGESNESYESDENESFF